MNETYNKWVIELANQEYKGDLKLLLSNIKNNGVLE